MSSSGVDFSAQFGGRDAATAVLPHFKALKIAARGIRLENFPFAEIAFILRVDGEVTRFGVSGADNLQIEEDGEYLSVDIVIAHDDRDRIPYVIAAAILSSINLIKSAKIDRPLNIDFPVLQGRLLELTALYEREVSSWRKDTS